jgi:hypothetical protein
VAFFSAAHKADANVKRELHNFSIIIKDRVRAEVNRQKIKGESPLSGRAIKRYKWKILLLNRSLGGIAICLSDLSKSYLNIECGMERPVPKPRCHSGIKKATSNEEASISKP